MTKSQNENVNQQNENEVAVDIVVQQKASLYGIASVIVGLGHTPKKKAMKKVVKQLRKDVRAAVGPDGGDELMKQNREVVEGIFTGIRRNPSLSDKDRKQQMFLATQDLYASYKKGLKNVVNG